MTIATFSTILFAVAILHTFLASKLARLSHRFPENSTRRALFHLLGEVEVVFGFWAGVFITSLALFEEPKAAIEYVESIKFTEPIFVFVIMVVCATRPIMIMARDMMSFISMLLNRILRLPAVLADVFVLLSIGPILGSFITEPAAMTVVALLLRSMIAQPSPRVLYAMLAVLFVNVSIGGSLTPFAAPPILMVAGKWGWDFSYVFTNFGIKGLTACAVNAVFFVFGFQKDILNGFKSLSKVEQEGQGASKNVPLWVKVIHLIFLVLIVLTHTFSNVFMGLFLFFMGVTVATRAFQESLRLREALLVSFFLAGLMVFGEFQQWWLQPLLAQLSDTALFFGATLLTAVTDNAALTFLGSQVEGLSDLSKYSLVAGALAGGGLTVLANAPNPAGYSILVNKFPNQTVNHLKLLGFAFPPTIVAILLLWS